MKMGLIKKISAMMVCHFLSDVIHAGFRMRGLNKFKFNDSNVS